MSQPCATPKCERISRGLCDCCKQTLCLQHLNEHNASLISQLNPLTDEINALGDRLKSFNIHQTVSDGRQKLDKWRKDCHEKIDRFFEEKCQELDRFVVDKLDRQRTEILHIQSKMAKLTREQEATRHDIDLLTSTIRQLEKAIDKIKETNIQINAHSLVIHGSLVQIRETNEHELDLSTLFPVYRTLDGAVGSSVVLASNEQLLLIHQKPNLCLVDQELKIVKQVLWTHDVIRDMCWSWTLDRFIVVDNNNNIFLVDERTMSIETIEINDKRKWSACACWETSLFLSTDVWGSSLLKLTLSPTIAVIKEWQSPITCSKDEVITGMSYTSKTCALMIKNKVDKSVRIELRSSETLNRIWSLPLDIVVNQNVLFRCCLTKGNEWLVIDRETKRLLHITKDGQLKTTLPYNEIPYRATMFTSNMLAVSTTTGINLHKV